jgi:transcriptional antiterminator RfaH
LTPLNTTIAPSESAPVLPTAATATKAAVAVPLWAWYAVHTHPRKEQPALENLQRQGFDSYLPVLQVQKVRRGKAQMVQEAMFPRYLFVRLDSSAQGRSWSPIRSTLGVRTLVQFGGKPAKVAHELIDWLRQREHDFDPLHLFQPGDTVAITEGPFKGLEALYQGVDGEHRALILLEILSKPVRMAVDAGALVRS